jgi:transcriptional regulator with XRE-family HTH domain
MLDGMALPEFRIPGYRDIERLAFEGRISMEELCRRAAINSSTFRYWKSGRSTPSVATLQALLDAGLAAVEAASREPEASGRPRRVAAKPGAKAKAPARAKAAASKRPARRQA